MTVAPGEDMNKSILPLKVSMTNQGAIPPMFTLGNKLLYWYYLGSIDKGSPTGVWYSSCKKVALESLYPAEMVTLP